MSLGGLDALFNPAKRHLDEEKLRLQSTREEVGDASGGKRIDLDSGKVRIRKPGSVKAAADDSAAVDESVVNESVVDESDGQESEPLAH